MTTTDVVAPATPTTSLDLSPAPGAAPPARMLLAQARQELVALVRNGEQLLLALVIPVLLLVAGARADVVKLSAGTRRIDALTPGVLALAALSIAFTGQAIATGFERRYGVLKRLGATPLPRWGLLGGKVLAVLAIEVFQVAVLAPLALALGWHPRGDPFSVIALMAAGTASFTALGLLLAGTLRAEATLALANLVWVLLVLTGGVVVPLSEYPSGAARAAELLPLGALAEGLRAVLERGTAVPVTNLLVLLAWALGAGALATRLFKWE